MATQSPQTFIPISDPALQVFEPTVILPPQGYGTANVTIVEIDQRVTTNYAVTNIQNVPGGTDGEIQFNSGAGFGGDSGLTYDSGTDVLSVGGNVLAGAIFTDNLMYANGDPWPSGSDGTSGYSGLSGINGIGGASGYSGASGATAESGYSGMSGASTSGYSGVSGRSGTTGAIGQSGYSGIDGTNGASGYSGLSGINGTAGGSGYSGASGVGISGYSGIDGAASASGYSGINGATGASGYSGIDGTIGTSGYSGESGYSGASGINGIGGASGYSGVSGTNGTIGESGYSGIDGTIGTSGYSGATGTTGASGYSGIDGTMGTSGYSGVSGANGTAGASGYSGTMGASGYSGTSGVGISGYSGVSGSTGTSGYSGTIVPAAIAFTTAVPLSSVIPTFMSQHVVAEVNTFTIAAGSVQGATTLVRLVADGINAPVFTGFTHWGGSLGYDNRNGIVNVIQFWFDGYDYWYSIGQQLGATPVVIVYPILNTATVANATPTTVQLVFSGALDGAYVPALSSFAVSGKTLSGVPVISGTGVTLTTTVAFTSSDSATVNYTQPGTNNLRSTTGGLVANFLVPHVIINNVTAAATGVTMTGPAGGVVSVASTNFSVGVTPNGSIITGTVVVTPNDSSGGGTFTPTSVSLSSGSPTGTFTYTPGSAGAKTIAVTNNGSLSDPSTITYTATAAATAPGAPTIGTAVAGDGSAQVAFTAPVSNGGSVITGYTATSSPGGLTGTLAQAGSGTITVSGLSNGTAYTFTVTATNAIGTGSASSASNQVTPAAAAYPRLTVLSNMTESGTGPYTYQSTNSGGFGTSGGVLNQSFQLGVDGSVALTNVAQYEFIFGLQTGAASVGTFATYPVALHTATLGAAYQAFTNGAGQTELSNTTNVAGDIIRLRRVGATVYGEVARAVTPSTFVAIFTWTGVSTSAIHPVVNVSGVHANIASITTVGLA